jgi:hypothetical protein
MKIKISLVASIVVFVLNSGNAQLKNVLDKAKETAKEVGKIGGTDTGLDIAGGLKEALETGVGTAVKQLSASNGYFESPYKILIPADAQRIIDKVKLVPGFADVETKLINQMNKAAELAAVKATPIFVDAIKGMSFSDAKAILNGPENAATSYLTTSSRQKLYDAFLPVIRQSLDEVNATVYWKTVVEAYNKIPLVKKLNPALDDHVNNKGLDGLFSLIELKEKGIRTDVSQRTSDLLKKVFGSRNS